MNDVKLLAFIISLAASPLAIFFLIEVYLAYLDKKEAEQFGG